MTTDQILTLVGMLGIPSIISTVLIIWLKARMDRQDKRAEARKTENELTMTWMLCAGAAMHEMAVVLKKLGANGELAAAVGKVDECGQKLQGHLVGENADNNH